MCQRFVVEVEHNGTTGASCTVDGGKQVLWIVVRLAQAAVISLRGRHIVAEGDARDHDPKYHVVRWRRLASGK